MDDKSYDPVRLARSVRSHRKAAGLTQAELAERADLAFETISRIESGREPPSLRTAISLADALSLPLDVVVGRTTAAPLGATTASPPLQRPELRRLLSFASKIETGMLRHLVAIARALSQRAVPGESRGKKRGS